MARALAHSSPSLHPSVRSPLKLIHPSASGGGRTIALPLARDDTQYHGGAASLGIPDVLGWDSVRLRFAS
jgi:hypothetical protein